MDKQQSEHIENRFRQAAENFIPPSNDEAWEKMEALLDKETDKKRVFIWWWPLALFSILLAGSAALYYGISNSPAEKITAIITGSKTGTTIHDRGEKERDPIKPGGMSGSKLMNGRKENTQLQNSFDSSYRSVAVIRSKQSVLSGRDKHSDNSQHINKIRQSHQLTGYYSGMHAQAGKGKSSAQVQKNGFVDKQEKFKQETDVLLPVYAIPLLQHDAYVYQINPADSLLKGTSNSSLLADSIQQAVHEAAKREAQNTKPSGFYFIAAAGKNATSLQKFDTKNVGTVYGGEIGYHLNSFWSIQAGVHVGRKIYFAGPSDYKFQGAYWSTVTVLKVDANCLIIDIPLSVRFNMLHNKNYGLYATAGLSSFIMNTEDYKYHFNTSSGAYRKSEMKYKGNTDLFSSANLSVGYEQKLFKTLFIQAEPYAKLPISGVGAGKIKLYSLGIQLGLKYQPLKRK